MFGTAIFVRGVDLRRRNPTGWTVASLLLPVLLYWFHKSNGQINVLNQTAGRPQRIMNPWWLTGSLFLLLSINHWTSFVLSFADFINSAKTSEPAASISDEELSARLNRLDQAGLIDYDYIISPEVFAEDPTLRRNLILLIGLEEKNLPADSSPPTFIVVLSLGWLLLYLNYLRQHLAGIKALDDDQRDRPLLTFGLNLAAVIFPPTVLIIVYRSQVVLNWAIDQSLPDSA